MSHNDTDVEERLHTLEKELTVARRQLAEALKLARLGSWEWDIPENTVWWSDELYRIYGLAPQSIEPSYEAFLEHVHPEDRADVDERNHKAFADHEPFEDVKRVIRVDDGREILMRTQGDVICDDADNPIRMVGICEDVTDAVHARDAERELAAAEALRHRALEINDEIIQRLVAADALLAAGAPEDAARHIREVLRRSKRIAGELVFRADQIRPGELRRTEAAS